VKKQSGNGDFFPIRCIGNQGTGGINTIKGFSIPGDLCNKKSRPIWCSCDCQRIQDVSNLHFLLRSSHSPEKWLWQKGQKFFEMPESGLFFILSLQGNEGSDVQASVAIALTGISTMMSCRPLHPFNPCTYLVLTPKGLK
jgi:hypothetical protein